MRKRSDVWCAKTCSATKNTHELCVMKSLECFFLTSLTPSISDVRVESKCLIL